MEEVYFRFDAGALGGIAGEGFDNGKIWQSNSRPSYTVPLLEILQRYQTPPQIDYLSLDVEGAESFIMTQFPLHRYRITLITAERLKGDVRDYLKSEGYEFVKDLTRWGEALWVRTEAKNELDWSVLDRLQFPRI